MIRRAVGGALALALLLTVATVHELHEGARAIASSDAALAQGDTRAAIAHARTAAEAMAPGSPYPERAYARLESLARDAEGRGDEAGAMAAWEAMRAASIETRGLFVDTEARRRMADDGLARAGSGAIARAERAMARTEVRRGAGELRDSLARDDAPTTWRLTLLALFAVSFISAAIRILLGRGTRGATIDLP